MFSSPIQKKPREAIIKMSKGKMKMNTKQSAPILMRASMQFS